MPSPQTVTFSSGNGMGTTACATYGIMDDNNLEFDHAFTVSVSSFTPSGPAISTTMLSTTVTINDDEGMHCAILINRLLLAGLE